MFALLLSPYCNVHGVRRLDAAAVDMCHVALGIVEAYWEYRLKTWDMAAGVLVMCFHTHASVRVYSIIILIHKRQMNAYVEVFIVIAHSTEHLHVFVLLKHNSCRSIFFFIS